MKVGMGRMTADPSPESQSGFAVPPPPRADAREQELRSRLALEAAGIGTWVWEMSSNQLIWDDITHQLFGVKPGEFVVRRENMEKLIHPEDCDRVGAEVAECARTGADFISEYRVTWPADGSVHHLRARGKIYRDGGEHVRLTGACWDITERKSMEEALANERFLLRTLMENIPDQIYFKDTASRFVRISDAMLSRFGVRTVGEVMGKTDFDFFTKEHAQEAFDDEQRIVQTGQPLLDLIEHETWRDGRETWVSTTKLPIRDPQGRIVGSFGLSRDITDRRRAEEQLARYAEELRRKNQELEEDLAMARELQNALLPRQYPCFPHDATAQESALHFSHFFNPSTSVSGDFFDILQLSDNTAGIFICDVMGHGMRAALVAAILRALVEELKGIGDTPGEFLYQLNQKLSGILKHTDIPMFASASYVVADIAKGEFRYANAGHPHPLCVRHERGGTQTRPLNHCKRGPVLGMFEGAQYGTYQQELSVHDIVLSFTDGLFEVEGVGGELYDEGCLIKAVSRRSALAAGDLCREVLTEIQQFSASKQFSDDVCLVSVEVERLIA